jgi:dihydrofolate synthase / folylpolyglutamate synthase
MSATLPHHEGSSFDAAYRVAMDYLFERLNYERVSHDSYSVEDFRLARMARLLELLGNPEHRLPVVHVAGTKGKGSTCAMLASMLEAAGLRVGLFTSPHLVRYEERLTVNRREPSPAEIITLVDALRPAVDQLVVEMPPGPTFFEVTTALAWLHFLSQRCDIAVLEVGLGGRLDSTNLCRPLSTIITSISRDHMRLLGETLPQIAAEKAGIIKPGVPVITGVSQTDVLAVIEDFASRNSAPLLRLDREIRLISHQPPPDQPLSPWSADVITPWAEHHSLRSPLPGPHQCRNLALAVTAFDHLSASWKPLPSAAIVTGLKSLHWPARIEVVSHHPTIIIDAAHNDASMTALCETIAPLTSRPRVLIFGTSRDKEAAAMLRILTRSFDHVILTRYLHNPRALPLEQLSALAADCLTVPSEPALTPIEAWQRAQSLAGSTGLICATGSVFLAAEMQAIAKGPWP